MSRQALGEDLSSLSLPIVATIIGEQSSADGSRRHLVRSESPVVLAGLVEEMEVLEHSGAPLDRSIYPASLLYELASERDDYEQPYQGSLRQLLRLSAHNAPRRRIRVENDLVDDTGLSVANRIVAGTEVLIAYGGKVDQLKAIVVPGWTLEKPGTSHSPDRSDTSRSRSPGRRMRQRLRLVYVPLDVVGRFSVCRSSRTYTFHDLARHASGLLPSVFTAYPQIDVTSDSFQQYQGMTALSFLARVSTYRMFLAICKNLLFKIPVDLGINFDISSSPDARLYANACRVLAEHTESGLLPEISLSENVPVRWVRDEGEHLGMSDRVRSASSRPSDASQVSYKGGRRRSDMEIRTGTSHPSVPYHNGESMVSKLNSLASTSPRTRNSNPGSEKLSEHPAEEQYYKCPKPREQKNDEAIPLPSVEYSSVEIRLNFNSGVDESIDSSAPRARLSDTNPSPFGGQMGQSNARVQFDQASPKKPAEGHGPPLLTKQSKDCLEEMLSRRVPADPPAAEHEPVATKPVQRRPGPTPKPRQKQAPVDGMKTSEIPPQYSFADKQSDINRPRLLTPSLEGKFDEETGLTVVQSAAERRQSNNESLEYAVPSVEVVSDDTTCGLGVVRSHSKADQPRSHRFRASAVSRQVVPLTTSKEPSTPAVVAQSTSATAASSQSRAEANYYDSLIELTTQSSPMRSAPPSVKSQPLAPDFKAPPAPTYELATAPAAPQSGGHDRPQLPLPPDCVSAAHDESFGRPPQEPDHYDLAENDFPPPPLVFEGRPWTLTTQHQDTKPFALDLTANLPAPVYDSVVETPAAFNASTTHPPSPHRDISPSSEKRPLKPSSTTMGGSFGGHTYELASLLPPFSTAHAQSRQASAHLLADLHADQFSVTEAESSSSYDYVEHPSKLPARTSRDRQPIALPAQDSSKARGPQPSPKPSRSAGGSRFPPPALPSPKGKWRNNFS